MISNTETSALKIVSKKKPLITHVYHNNKYLREIPKKFEHENVVVLYLHNNAITKIDHLDSLKNLTHLYLQWNKIRQIENLNSLINLKKLYLGNNQISVIEKLENLVNLKELHVEKQLLDYGEVVCFDPRCIYALGDRLEVLNISNNKLMELKEISPLKCLRVLIAKNNNFQDHNKISEIIQVLYNVKELDFKGNPMCKNHRYKEKIIASCGKIDIIDGQTISNETRTFLKHFDIKQRMVKNVPVIEKKVEGEKSENKISMTELAYYSPDKQLSMLEAQRIDEQLQFKANKLRLKEASDNGVPRCFWRNKTCKKSKGADDKMKAPFDEFFKMNYSDWI